MDRIAPATKTPPVVVCGGGVTGVDVLRCLRLAGIPSMLVTDPGDLARYSRLPFERLHVDADVPEAMLARIGTAITGEATLIPCSDLWARAVAPLHDGSHPLASRLHTSTPAPDVIDVLADKHRFARVLDALDVPHPVTIAVEGEATIDQFHDHELQGGFLKPVDSQSFAERFRCKAFTIYDRAHARACVRAAEAAGLRLVLQQFVEGPPEGHIFLDGFVDRRRRTNVLLARRRLRMHPPRYGNSTLTEVIGVDDVAGPVKHLRRLFDALEFSGPFCAEFVRDRATDRHLLLEVNGRCWWQVGLTAACRANVPARIHADALGDETAAVDVGEIGVRWSHPVADVQSWSRAVLTGQRIDGGSPPLAWQGGWVAATTPIDPLPGVMLWGLAAGAAAHRIGRAVALRMSGQSRHGGYA